MLCRAVLDWGRGMLREIAYIAARPISIITAACVRRPRWTRRNGRMIPTAPINAKMAEV